MTLDTWKFKSIVVLISYLAHYNTSLQNATDIVTKCGSYFITKWDKSLIQNGSGFLLQNATVLLQYVTVITKCVESITKCDSYLPIVTFLTKCVGAVTQDASDQGLIYFTGHTDKCLHQGSIYCKILRMWAWYALCFRENINGGVKLERGNLICNH